MFCIKICFLEPEPVGTELFGVELEPEPIFFTWIRSRKKKYLEPEPRKNGNGKREKKGLGWSQLQ